MGCSFCFSAVFPRCTAGRRGSVSGCFGLKLDVSDVLLPKTFSSVLSKGPLRKPQAALNKQRAKNKRKNMCLIEINRISELKTCMFNHVCHVFSDRLARCRGRLFDHLLRGELHRPHGEPGGGHSAFAAVRDGLPNGEGSEARWKGSTAWGLRSSCDTCGLVHGWTGLHGVSVTGHGVVGGFCKHNQTASR